MTDEQEQWNRSALERRVDELEARIAEADAEINEHHPREMAGLQHDWNVMLLRAEAAEARLATVEAALGAFRTLVSNLETCRTRPLGVSGMTIEAQMRNSVLVDVRGGWLVDARNALDDYDTALAPEGTKP